MQDFIFHNPTKIIFEQNSVSKIGTEASIYGKKALLVYGRESIKKNGIYDNVAKSLKTNHIEVIEHGGVKSNPLASHANEGIKKIKEYGLDMVIAVGGGSVIDEAKAISAGAATGIDDAWEIYKKGGANIKNVLPLLTILTLPATGTEMNGNTVLTNDETQEKFGLGNPKLHPITSILDVTTTYTIPKTYTAYSSVDAISHLLEAYFTQTGGWTPIQDRYVESLIKSIIEATNKIMINPSDTEARSTMMWAATLAWNGLPVCGIGSFTMPNHMLEHPLSGVYDIAHGAGLSIVMPVWMMNEIDNKTEKLARFAKEVFDIENNDKKEQAKLGILALKSWFKKIGSPVTMKQSGISNPDLELLTKHALAGAKGRGINYMDYDYILDFYKKCL